MKSKCLELLVAEHKTIFRALDVLSAIGQQTGLVGALVGMGIPKYEAKRYEGRIKSGGILLSVHCDNSEWTKMAKQILKDTGAEEVSSTGSLRRPSLNRTDQCSDPMSQPANPRSTL
jgi:hypothetical protein